MNSLTDLKKQLSDRGHPIIGFEGWWLETHHGRFTLSDETVYLDGKSQSSKEVKEIVNGEPQARKSKEPTRRVPDVQAAQGKRSKAEPARKSGSGKGKRATPGN
jgi:hypothetical protein